MGTPSAGFTLIEVIAALLIVGILGAIAGMGIITGMRGYMQTKENAHLAQKSQIAMTRISRELRELTDIIARDDSSDPWVIFDNPIGRQALAKIGNTLQLYSLAAGATDLSGATGDIIVDQVDSLSITYHSGTNPSWLLSDGIDLLSAVEVDVNLMRMEAGGATLPFSITVNPRNTKNFSGASTTIEPYTAPQYQCFISSAGYIDTLTILRCICSALTLTLLIWLAYRILMFLKSKTNVIWHNLCRWPTSLIHTCGIKFVSNGKGNVLVGLVVTMLLFAALGAGMVSMTGTSSTSQVVGNTAVRAYYIAESGFRYAASRYLNTTDANNRYDSKDEKNQTLQALDNRTYNMSADDGQFLLRIYPYFLSVLADANQNATSLYTRFPGSQPNGFTLPPAGIIARIKIGNIVHSYGSYNIATGQFSSISPPLVETVYQNATVKLVGIPSGSALLSQGGNLTLASANFFPQIQGRIKINGVAYGYTTADYSTNTLQDIYKVDDPSESFSISVDTTTDVVVEPFVQVRSIGSVGTGDLAAMREVVYNTPLPEKPGAIEAVEFLDEFNDLGNWNTATLGSFAIENIGGTNALAVSSVEPGFGILKASLIGFNWTHARVNFPSTHRTAGYYLSYDNQVKIGFDTTPFPETGWGPEGSPIPKHFATGISFRLDENQNFYGLSYMRGCKGTEGIGCNSPDRLDDDIVPVDDVKLVVLWQQTSDGASRQWLAYSEVGLLFSDGAELEPPPGKWTIDDDHPGDPLWTRADNYAFSGTYSWSTSPTDNYIDPPADEIWNDTITSEPIDLSNATSAELTFRTRYRIWSCQDWGLAEISGNGGSSWITLNDQISQHCGGSEPDDSSTARYTSNSDEIPGNINGWLKKSLDISSFVGNPSVIIRFRFERNCCNTRNGWWIDDIRVIQDFDINESSLLVRVYEAAPVEFDSGGRTVGPDTIDIDAGDIVFQTNGARGRVIVPPILSSGSWAAGSATGMLWLNNTTDTAFSNALQLNVQKPSGSNIANVTNSSVRSNFIQAFYGAQSGVSPPTSADASGFFQYDQERLRNDFGIPNWPPNPLYAADRDRGLDGTNDYFTLVQWNDVVQGATRLSDENGRYTIIASDQSELFTPTDTFIPYTRPELGLHAIGHGAANVFYRDFAIRAGMAVQTGLIPIQQ